MTVSEYYTATEGLEPMEDYGDRLAAEGEQHHGQVRLAYRLAGSHADRLMHVHGLGWMAWDGKRWAEDDRGAARRAVNEVLRVALAESLDNKELRRDVERCETDASIRGVLAIASALEPFAQTVADLDPDPYLLNCANGTLDLRTRQLREHDPRDRITKVTTAAYRPDSCGSEWRDFLERVLPDAEVRGYLQRFAGLALLGKVLEHVFTIATGTGANGKGTAYSAILFALGEYGHVAESDLFMQAKKNPQGASPALMALMGKRLVVVSETERDHRLAAALMKNLTGGDPIAARPLYGKPVTFMPSHTSLMVTNFLPKVDGDDPAVWRRIRVVPFDVVIPADERNSHLGARLEADAESVLAWAVEGYAQYELVGLAEPEGITGATGDYQKSSDAVSRFIDDCCLVGPHFHATTTELHERWVRWAIDDGAEPLSVKKFGQALDTHGHHTKGGTGRDRYNRLGIGLAAEEDGYGWGEGR